jgi:putative membrane protein
MKYISFPAVGNFLLYMAATLALLALFTWLYKLWTPYDEFVQMRAGKKAPAFALGGAMLGFTFPLLSLSFHGINIVDFAIWSVVACAVQLLLFKILYWLIPMQIEEDNQAIGIFYSFAAVCVGLINAFSLIPSGV